MKYTELEVKDTSKLEQNLSLHPIHHSYEPDLSNQTIISPPSQNMLLNNPSSTSSPQSLLTPQYSLNQIGTSTQQPDKSLCIPRNRPKQTVDPNIFEELCNLRRTCRVL